MLTSHRGNVLLIWIASLLVSPSIQGADWHHPFDRDGGDYWRQRVRVTIENPSPQAVEGRPVSLPMGTEPGSLPIVGARAESIRVCAEDGEEFLYSITNSAGAQQTRGVLAKGSVLTVPMEAKPRMSQILYVYYDNPSAGEVADFLDVRIGLENGDLEQGEGSTPDGWRHDAPDGTHQTSWVREHPQSGTHCLKTIVAEHGEPSWISTRQHEVPIVGGARYRIEGWVAARNVKGMAGWYIHVGNREQPMMVDPMLSAGSGSFDWKKISTTFVAPSTADRADLGTVLRGTGTAWFDNVRLTCLDRKPEYPVKIAAPERVTIRESAADASWTSDRARNLRAMVKVIHLGRDSRTNALAAIKLDSLRLRFPAFASPDSLVVLNRGKQIPFTTRENTLLFPANVSGMSIETYHIYGLDPEHATPASKPEMLQLASKYNLVRNGDFDDGTGLPHGWQVSAPSTDSRVKMGFDDPNRSDLGRRCARMIVPDEVPAGWRGWVQEVAVRPHRTYLISGAVKCANVKEGEVRIHVHRRRGDGEYVEQEPILSIGSPIHGTTDWTMMSGVMTMPADTAKLQIHLTMDRSGTVWHDSILVAEVLPAKLTALEHRPNRRSESVQVWPMPAVRKVFREDIPPNSATAAAVSLARNEREVLQIAVRSPVARRAVKIQADPPVGPRNARLPAPEIGVVGYVPIDHPTDYYQSKTPAWHRKYPRGGGQSDGWAGDWPDPVLPRSQFDLEMNATQPLWLTFRTDSQTTPGAYQGTIRLVEGSTTLATIAYTVQVWDYTLPETSHLKAIYDIGPGPGGERYWRASPSELYSQVAPFMASRRTSSNRIQPDPDFSYEGGVARADFREFDRAATLYFEKWKLPHSYMPNLFYVFGWGFPPKAVFGEAPYDGPPPFENVDRSKLRANYKKAYQACLRLFWTHVKEKGWSDRFVLYISDEPFYDREPIRIQMKALCAMIHEVDPKIPIYSSTWHHVPEWEGSLDIWGIGHYGVVAPETMSALRKSGARVWFTTDGQMCTDTPYCAVERLLPYYCFAHGAEAYEFWGVSWLTHDPYRFGWHAYINQSDAPGQSYWVRYPNGDGYLLYPGSPVGVVGPVTSIRLEQAREGIEDYEAMYLLQTLLDKRLGDESLRKRAMNALDAARSLVPIPNAGGRYSSRILADPALPGKIRDEVSRVIELFGRP